MKYLKWVLTIILIPVAAFVLFLTYSIAFEYRPATVEDSISVIRNGKGIDASKPLELTTFNIGYAGLDRGQDFFMDGGKMSRSSSEEQTKKNMDGITKFMVAKASDFYLLQEVDEKADRSNQLNEIDLITTVLPGYNASFAYNYKVKWVPVPISAAMGGAISGMMTMSRGDYERSIRYQLPGDEPIPKRFFDLKRCVMENTYQLSNGKELIVINLHLSAYDEGGTVRAEQVAWLEEHLQKAYDKDKNYVIVGGDWNHILSVDIQEKINTEIPDWVAVLPSSLTVNTGFKILYDEQVNTVRNNDKPYVEGENFETIIDGFLVSPNLKVLSVKTTHLGFQNSDHQPVTIQVGF